MKPLDDIQYNEIDEQIKIRKDLISICVGNLYPLILNGEIEKLEKMRKEFITKKEMEL